MTHPGIHPSDRGHMAVALDAVAEAASAGEVPVGAMVYSIERGIIAKTANRTRRDWDATGHAEIQAIRAAGSVLGRWSLEGCTLYVTLEPCAMCAGAIVLARLDRVVFGAWDEKAGMGGSVGDILRHPRLNHRVQVTPGVMAEESSAMLKAFFEARRGTAGVLVDDAPMESL